ncbi:MAG TPA: hypothetical protein VGL58_00735 [Caulobacteraceae bacterium]|jgi:predicted nucleotidyltransferase
MSTSTPAQEALLARLQAALTADARVDATWLAGSFGRGEGDIWSDIDAIAIVDAEDRAACLVEYTGSRNPVGETVLLRALFDRIAHGVRPDWERYDILFLTQQEFRRYDRAALKPLTPESLAAPPMPPAPTPAYQPSADHLAGLAQEFLRILGLAPAAFGREEWLSAQEGAGLMRNLLIEMMFEANGIGRAQRGGVKRLNPYLTPEQRAAVEAIPAPAASREALIAASEALARLFLPLAKATLADGSAPWPQPLEDATRTHLARTCGIVI